MQIKDQTRWNEYKEANQDPYGGCVIRFAEAWADAIEEAMAKGETLEAVAERLCREVDRRPGFGITGAMYGMAIVVLSQCWEHGEALRRWHNLDLSPEQGAEANDKPGAVLNPAMIVIAGK